jgi:hypothetical protein
VPGGAVTHSAESRTTTIILVGDSTVTDTAGWGSGFKQFMDERARASTQRWAAAGITGEPHQQVHPKRQPEDFIKRSN